MPQIDESKSVQTPEAQNKPKGNEEASAQASHSPRKRTRAAFESGVDDQSWHEIEGEIKQDAWTVFAAMLFASIHTGEEINEKVLNRLRQCSSDDGKELVHHITWAALECDRGELANGLLTTFHVEVTADHLMSAILTRNMKTAELVVQLLRNNEVTLSGSDAERIFCVAFVHMPMLLSSLADISKLSISMIIMWITTGFAKPEVVAEHGRDLDWTFAQLHIASFLCAKHSHTPVSSVILDLCREKQNRDTGNHSYGAAGCSPDTSIPLLTAIWENNLTNITALITAFRDATKHDDSESLNSPCWQNLFWSAIMCENADVCDALMQHGVKWTRLHMQCAIVHLRDEKASTYVPSLELTALEVEDLFHLACALEMPLTASELKRNYACRFSPANISATAADVVNMLRSATNPLNSVGIVEDSLVSSIIQDDRLRSQDIAYALCVACALAYVQNTRHTLYDALHLLVQDQYTRGDLKLLRIKRYKFAD